MVTGNYEVIKSINTSLVLDALRIHRELSRSDIARITGLTTGTITNITNKLLELDLIREIGASSSASGGRKPVLLQINDDGAYSIAVDIRTTSIEIRLVDLRATTIESIKKDGIFNMEDGMKVIIDSIDSLREEDFLQGEKLLGVGISIPGWLDYQSGRIIKIPNLAGWDNYPIKDELEDVLNLPVFIENDANLSALAELWFGKGKAYDHMIYVLIEDGIGSGFILNRQVYRGNGVSVGELGHLPISSEDRMCNCGNKGCLDTISSAMAMVDRYKEVKNESITFDDFIELVKREDELALQIIKEAADNLGIGISILLNLFHPQAIIIGGKVVDSIPSFVTYVKQTVAKKTLFPMLQNMVILTSDLEDNSTILGAVALVYQSTLQPYSLNSI